MKANIHKYICLVSTLIVAILMFTKWFTVDLAVSVENHSFLTIPNLINAAVDFLKDLGGATVAFTILLLAGILEYLCILASALGIWGFIRTFMKKSKSRLIFVSQCTALCLVVIATIVIIMVDIVSASALGGVISIYPTVWFVLTAVFLAASLVSGAYYAKDSEGALQE